MESQTIIKLEELAFRAWPALEEKRYDGWTLRFADGYTKRANSVNPLYAGAQNVNEKIDRCERLYRAKNLKPIFRLTPAAQPDGLEEILAERGYFYRDVTGVQKLDLASFRPLISDAFTWNPEVSSEWLNTFVQVNEAPTSQTHREILRRIIPQQCFGTLVKENRPVACGLGVLDGDYLGLFDLVTAPAERRKGYGRELVTNILSWAALHGAKTAYLQVVADNRPALSLYKEIGFKEIYKYWYRIKEK